MTGDTRDRYQDLEQLMADLIDEQEIDEQEIDEQETGEQEIDGPKAGIPPISPDHRVATVAGLLADARALSDELASRPNLGLNTAPVREIGQFAERGLLTATLPTSLGGLGIGVEPGTQLALLRLLAIVGGADLALGRIYEGHVNGLLLVHRYGSPAQNARLAEDCQNGLLSGVWNTGAPAPLRLHPHGQGFYFEGVKTFATGSAFVKRPIVTAELSGTGQHKSGWQMTMPCMETANALLDRSFWHPLGMESSESFQVDFTGSAITQDDLVGEPGDFYREPLFRGGAIRFAAVQTGALLRLHAMFSAWLDDNGRGNDPYQIARLGEIAMHAQEAVLWIEKAAAVAEESFFKNDKQHTERMIECANMMRVAVEKKATQVMQLVVTGVGAHGLLQPHRFERIVRDLTMYLRQPAPDQTLAAIGRTSLDKANRRSSGTEWGFWSDGPVLESLPQRYFDRIYKRHHDPWQFETSPYEQEKYAITLEHLPGDLYESALEIGCSIGVLTSLLALRTKHLLSLDVSQLALGHARRRNASAPHVHFACMQVPDELPDDKYELIVVSEVAYYWQLADLERAATALAAIHLFGGHLLLVHLTEFVPDYPLTGDDVHNYWIERPEWKRIDSFRHQRFRLDVLERIAED